MWKAAAGQSVSVAVDNGADDWETDPDFEVRDYNDVTHDATYDGSHNVTQVCRHIDQFLLIVSLFLPLILFYR